MFDKLKQEFKSRISNDPQYYFNPHWLGTLEYYMNLAYTVGYEEASRIAHMGSARKVIRVDIFGSEKAYDSILEAAKDNGIKDDTLRKWIYRNGDKEYHGFHWKIQQDTSVHSGD